MSSLFSHLDRISHRLFQHSYGWTGVEIGCHCINMAQIRKIDNRWQLAAVWSVEHPTAFAMASIPNVSSCDETFGWLTSDKIFEHGLAPTLEHLENLNALFHGRNCAATLTDGMIAYRELDLPACDPSDSQAMVRSEIALELDCELEDLLTDCWELPQNRPRLNASSFGAVSLRRSTAMQLAGDLLRAGFDCQTLDAMPCAMARATSMVVEDIGVATLAIDLGYHQATLTLVQDGQPIMSRGLRELGLFHLLELIAISFEISLADAQTLLLQSPSNQEGDFNAMNDFSNPLQQRLGGYLQTMAHEVDKTIQFSSRTYRTMIPSQILLMGAGVKIPALDHAIEYRVGLPTRTWAIDVSENLFGNQHVGAFAIAAGLSSLAWEVV